MILLLDNYDSFTWNLHHYLTQLSGEPVIVKRNDEISLSEASDYKSIVLSPGPGLPADAGIMPELILKYGHEVPIFGICLGHQAIGEAYGAKLTNLDTVLHGVQRAVFIEKPEDRIFKGLPDKINSGHYHSWVLSSNEIPDELEVTARDADGVVMAISHKTFPISGVQFHPESVMTDYGMQIMENWLHFCNRYWEVHQSPVHI